MLWSAMGGCPPNAIAPPIGMRGRRASSLGRLVLTRLNRRGWGRHIKDAPCLALRGRHHDPVNSPRHGVGWQRSEVSVGHQIFKIVGISALVGMELNRPGIRGGSLG